jgi:hypothetical protein
VDCLYLVKNGVPFDVAFSLAEDERVAWIVIMGRFNGLNYDWAERRWMSI